MRYMNHNLDLDALLKQAMEADVTALRQFLTTNLEQPLVATGSGGAESVADFAALLYGARGGIATAVSPYTLNVYSDEALKTSKLLLVSKGGHNNDIVFAAKRGLAVNPTGTASFTLSTSDRNDGAPLSPEDFKEVRSFVVLHGSWGRPSAANLEGMFVESSLYPACVVDFRNYCHGRFIFTSAHLEDSAVVMFVSPREKDIAARTRKFLPHRPNSSSSRPTPTPPKPPWTFSSGPRPSSSTSAGSRARTGSRPRTPARSTSDSRCGCRSWRK